MGKPKLKVQFRIPPYCTPRYVWRRQIHGAAAQALRDAAITYGDEDELELDFRIYLKPPMLRIHDVDNRLKDVMDALQGRVGGTRQKRGALPALIPNDRQICRVVVEKEAPPTHGQGFGQVTLRSHVAMQRYRKRRAAAVKPQG